MQPFDNIFSPAPTGIDICKKGVESGDYNHWHMNERWENYSLTNPPLLESMIPRPAICHYIVRDNEGDRWESATISDELNGWTAGMIHNAWTAARSTYLSHIWKCPMDEEKRMEIVVPPREGEGKRMRCQQLYHMKLRSGRMKLRSGRMVG